MQIQPNADPLGRRNSMTGQHDASCCVAGSVFPASCHVMTRYLVWRDVTSQQRRRWGAGRYDLG